ncbi:hypothetical protein M703_05485 [Neisseria gonorrhoeae SK29344]|uniref:Uncharacterized protein n=1 Tax=Neisseria gonorrhoeae 3502 TaxID=1193404 RepID=A0AA44UAG4_NEIGO|nr:hypothetical protein T556_03720 [Neisseria gonorrhoeae NG-k51.05]KLR77290.1 hypothetical protein M717_04440 [Neisseria gonorrhoeae SK33414]KLR80864.1 hypothetical protein M680_07715 [Neisseria gonorrhoeae SK8976]KLR86231.1 hypothetical protein M684_05695 [Neisseria gonorrhoeae SK15454]KLR88601.1 hypothetical protein M702_02105 [Neisseria gonorrhoeae SK28355]KLR89086.1 hypothetical protein M677_10020 [Neisseria gonorrhoeae SK6987]KLR92533.1 hypothetical protein M678_12270 [Neisseria gonorrh
MYQFGREKCKEILPPPAENTGKPHIPLFSVKIPDFRHFHANARLSQAIAKIFC